jgi:hypothetical protein
MELALSFELLIRGRLPSCGAPKACLVGRQSIRTERLPAGCRGGSPGYVPTKSFVLAGGMQYALHKMGKRAGLRG